MLQDDTLPNVQVMYVLVSRDMQEVELWQRNFARRASLNRSNLHSVQSDPDLSSSETSL